MLPTSILCIYTLSLTAVLPHSCRELHEREVLDQYLARALGLQSTKLTPIDEENFVLTPDYTIKLLNIHECYECGVPVIIRGETGVGKIALVNLLTRLWSHSLLHLWEREKDRILHTILQMLSAVPAESLDQALVQTVQKIVDGKEVTVEELVFMGRLPHSSTPSGMFHSKLRDDMLKMAGDPVRALLFLPLEKEEQKEEEEGEEDRGREKLNDIFEKADSEDTAEVFFSMTITFCTHLLLFLLFLLAGHCSSAEGSLAS